MNSKVIFGQYYNSNSWIHRLDPRTKLLSLIALMVGVFLLSNLYVLLGVLAFVLILICTSKVPMGKFLNSLKMMVFLLVFTSIFQVIFNNSGQLLATFEFDLNIVNCLIIICLFVGYFLLGRVVKKFRILQLLLVIFLSFYIQTVLHVGFSFTTYEIQVYDSGLNSAARIIIRIVSLLLLSSLLTLTTKPTDLNNGLELLLKPLTYLKIKVGIFTMMISIALRFIPTLINEAEKILKAQASRGVDFKEGHLKDKITQIIALIIPMFIISYNRADDLANAMEARGYNPDGKRTSINVLKFRAIDYITVVIAALILGLFIFLRVTYAL